jgi:tetratricopeptide (TPR) repeat protein
MRAAKRFAWLLVPVVAVGCGAKGKSAEDGAPTAHKPPLTKTAFDTDKEPAINAETRYAAGQLAETQNNPINAIKQYDEALRLKADHVPSLYRLGVIYAQVKEYPKAIEAWKRYLKATHDSANGYGNLGFCYELSGDSKAAEGAYLKGIAKDPKNQPCHVNYGLMLARMDRITDAITQLRAVLTPAEVSYNLGSVHEQKGHKEQAKAEYQKALELDPDFVDAKQRLVALE